MGRAGTSSGAYVYDLTTNRPVFALRDGVGRAPASVEKLFTSVALLSKLGPDARLHTGVLGTGSLGSGGVWHGTLYLRGRGDPTFGSDAFNRTWLGGSGASLSDLVAQLASRGIRRLSGSVIGDGTRFDGLRGGPTTGYAPDVLDLGGQLSGLTYNHGSAVRMPPEAFAGRQLALALSARTGGTHRPGPRASAALAPASAGVTPGHARPLASVSSPPLSDLLRLMNVPSDDFFAEMLLKQLGARFGRAGSTRAGASVASGVLARYGVHPRIVDGSGLSREDRASPAEVVDLLRAISGTPLGEVLQASLPTVGVNGTVRRIAKGTGAEGKCVAKTGTLSDVTNLAGYCHGAGNHQLAFAVFIDGPSNERSIALLSRIVADMVRLDPSRP
jgi:D-alanyl-D-alanine carboxypeptidase/D-alanyl-D-alanine-endopeptidase (penicillin-binding protein 4)